MKKHKKLALLVLNTIDLFDFDFHSGECVSITCESNEKNVALLSILAEYVGDCLTYDSDSVCKEEKKLIEISELAFIIGAEYDGKKFK